MNKFNLILCCYLLVQMISLVIRYHSFGVWGRVCSQALSRDGGEALNQRSAMHRTSSLQPAAAESYVTSPNLPTSIAVSPARVANATA